MDTDIWRRGKAVANLQGMSISNLVQKLLDKEAKKNLLNIKKFEFPEIKP